MRHQQAVKFSFLLLLILSFTIFCLAHQEVSAATRSLTVKVIDPNNQPIANAEVTVTAGAEIHTQKTDLNGMAYFSNLQAIVYTISATAPAYPSKAPMPVDLSANDLSVVINFGYTKAYFTLTPDHPAINQRVDFNASASFSSGTITGYSWNFGDGATGSGVTAHHAYRSAGTYLATVTVVSTVGAATYSQTVIVGTNVVPPIIATIVFVFIVPMLIVLLWNRRQPPYIIIQSAKPECVLCHGYTDGDCDGTQCKMSPC
jgi:PKD repeat protein